MSEEKRRRYKKKKARIEHHDDGEGNWLISYADLMTLLWGFFVIISAFSVPSQDLIEKLKESTAESMGGEYEKPYNEISTKLLEVLTELNLKDDFKIDTLSDGIKLSINSSYFFNSGSFKLNKDARLILEKIGDVIQTEDENFRVYVEGHTDDEPMKNNSLVPSNWELSSRRATTVVRLFETRGVLHKLLRPIGLADVDPLINVSKLSSTKLRSARAKNRRIVIRLQKLLPSRMKQVKSI